MATLLKIKGPQGSGKTMIARWLEAGLQAEGKNVVRLEGDECWGRDLRDIQAEHASADLLIVEEQCGAGAMTVELGQGGANG